jgi:REP element-mobilizing transposase RayT
MLYHIVCLAKYRKAVFTEPVVYTLKQSCFGIAARYEIHFVEIGADEDYVHFLTQSVPMMLPKAMAQTINGITAQEIFKYHREVRKILWGGKFWTKGYYIAMVGARGSESVIAAYVKNQGKQYTQFHRDQPTLFERLA